MNTIPDVDHIIPDKTVKQLPPGTKMAIICKLAESLATQVTDPDQWYEQLGRFRIADGSDWGTHLAAGSNTREDPIAPEEFHETLPAVLHNWRQTSRALDNTMLTISMMADRAITVDKDTVLGIPSDIKKWRTGHGYIADRLGIETRQAAQYRDRAQLVRQQMSTIEGSGEPPQLPMVATAYGAGELPPENLDTIARSLKLVRKYLRAVRLAPENIREVIAQLDESFRNAATTVKPAELSKLTDDMLAQAAAIIDADGPPPEEVLNKIENSFRYKIVNNKLKVEIITDVINLELFLGIMYAGLNFRAHQNRYSSSPHQARESVDDLLADPSDPRPNNGPAPSDDDAHRQGFMDDVLTQLPPDATPQKILSATQDKLDEEINDRTIHAVTMDGRQLSKAEMDRLDPRPRHERLHDVYIAHLRATGRLDPSVHGLSLFGGAPTQLRVALDYETFTGVLDEQLPAAYDLPKQHRRLPGIAGFDTGSPRYIEGLQLAPEQIIETENDGTTLIEIDLSKYSDSNTKLRIPKPRRGHPFISRTTFRGTTAPQNLRSRLCDVELIPQVLGSSKVLLDRGRAVRTFSHRLKLDLANYGSCSIPDCRSPVAYTDGHHLIWWSQGGSTNADNVTLLCPSCHTLVHKHVWTPVFDSNSQLYWKPAAWLDPTQTPLRNTYWS